MPLLYLVGLLLVVGVLLWLINTYVPMDSKIKGILNAVVVIVVVIYLLQVFGLMSMLQDIKVGHQVTLSQMVPAVGK
jgi:formate hydrogenlyase subunit 4